MADPNEGNPLAQFIVSGPLYEPREIAVTPTILQGSLPGERSSVLNMPKIVHRYCADKKCDKSMMFTRSDRKTEHVNARYMHEVWFACKHCESSFAVWIRWDQRNDGKVVVEKYGELPRQPIALPKSVEKSLKNHSEFWRKGMRLRNQGDGIGALTYFRRMIEDMTNELLELVANAKETRDEPLAEVEKVRNLLKGKATYDVKIREAAEMIPAVVRPGGINPLKMIFDIVSPDIHSGTDQECCEKVDGLAKIIALFVARVNEEVDDKRELLDATKILHKAHSKPKE